MSTIQMKHIENEICIVLVDNVIVRNMTIVAGSHFSVRTVVPGNVLRSHYVAVDTGTRIIAQVCSGLGKSQDENAQSHHRTTEQDHGDLPFRWRFQELEVRHWSNLTISATNLF